ncbi:hypothetical protein [Pseudomonas sp. KCJK9009]|uniref:hypothetical protein n=1 Tax=Pseudomonas sp. KCJK9009 TaxID=3344561 RepID=UPI003906B60E
MNTSKINNANCTDCTPEKLSAIAYAFRSSYCAINTEPDIYRQHQMYFLMTNQLEITGCTYEPSIQDGQHCVAASDSECDFILQFQINWPNCNPSYSQLEIFRSYYKAREAMFKIKQGYPKKKRREHIAKVEILRNLP